MRFAPFILVFVSAVSLAEPVTPTNVVELASEGRLSPSNALEAAEAFSLLYLESTNDRGEVVDFEALNPEQGPERLRALRWIANTGRDLPELQSLLVLSLSLDPEAEVRTEAVSRLDRTHLFSDRLVRRLVETAIHDLDAEVREEVVRILPEVAQLGSKTARKQIVATLVEIGQSDPSPEVARRAQRILGCGGKLSLLGG